MKFFCEYCGNRIDAEKDSKCPNCGASYKKNESFIKLEAEKKRQTQTNQENAQKIFNHVFGVFKFSRIIFFIPIMVFVVAFVSIIIVAFNFGEKKTNSSDNNFFEKIEGTNQSNDNNFNDFFDDIIDEKEEEQEKIVVVGLDQYAETKEYKVKVTKYETEKDIFNRLDKDYEYVKFHLVVENLKGDRITKEDVNCIVDGIAQTNYYSSGYSDLPMFINKGLTVKGTATFEVPKNTNSYEIRYGDYVTIKISK